MKESKGNASLSLSSDSKKAKDAMKIKKKDGKNKKSSREIKVESEDKDTDAVLTGATGEWALLEREGTINLYSGKPGSECGVMVDASSYFDRFVNLFMFASSAACLPARPSIYLSIYLHAAHSFILMITHRTNIFLGYGRAIRKLSDISWF